MRVLVTGGSGFIGSHIAEQLRQHGDDVAVLDNLSTGSRDNLPPDIPFFLADTRDRSQVVQVFNEWRPEVVCHQAAQMSVSHSVREPSFDADVNILGLLNVLENCVRTSVRRIVFASSGGVLYGEVAETADEEHPQHPISPYGISKLVGEQYLRFFAREHGLEAVALRYANVYGPRQNPHGEAGVVAIFCQRMLATEPTLIHGDGGCLRDYVFVSDVAEVNLRAMNRRLPDRFTAFNVGASVGIDVNDLSRRLLESCRNTLRQRGKLATIAAPRHGPPRPGDLRRNVLACSKVRQVFDWTPQVSLEQGLHQTVEWFASRLFGQ